MTYFMPGMVIDVSAILVARMHLRILGGAGENIFACWLGGRAAYMGQMSTWAVSAFPVTLQIYGLTPAASFGS